MTVKAMPYPLGGGLDLVTSPMVIPPGKATAGLNYEPHPRGYQRVDGYERFDGRPKPSEATYYILNYYDAVGGALSTVG
jgi:hypothetical protein